ncbi:MAG: hypothetical protein AB1757_21995 [Acidobacteriota bacterium]
MATPAKGNKKTYILSEKKLRRAQKLLGTSNEVETIERALDEVIAEREKNRRAWLATERLLKSNIEVKDVFGRLDS